LQVKTFAFIFSESYKTKMSSFPVFRIGSV